MACDLADLPRLALHYADADKPDEAARALFERAGVAAQIRHIAAAEAQRASWSVLIAPADLVEKIKPAAIKDMYKFDHLVRVTAPATMAP